MDAARRALEQALELARVAANPQQVVALIEQALAALGPAESAGPPPPSGPAFMRDMMTSRRPLPGGR